MNRKYHVYIMATKFNKMFYIGVSGNLQGRVKQHKNKYWDFYQVNFAYSLGNSLAECLFFAIGFVLSDRKEDFKSLLDLWQSGNIPLGVDKKHNLGILCATSLN